MGGNYIKQPKGLTDKTHEATIGDTKLTVKAVKTEYIVAGSKANNTGKGSIVNGNTTLVIEDGIIQYEADPSKGAVVGGNYIKASSPSAGMVSQTNSTVGDTSVTINGGTFGGSVYGSSFAENYAHVDTPDMQLKLTTGNSSLQINGGTYNGHVVAGSGVTGQGTSSTAQSAAVTINAAKNKTVTLGNNSILIGGDYLANRGKSEIEGNTSVTVTGEGTITLGKGIVGGSYVAENMRGNAAASGGKYTASEIKGTTNILVDAANVTVKDEVIGGTYLRQTVKDTDKDSFVSATVGSTNLILKAGTFKSNVIAGGYAALGATSTVKTSEVTIANSKIFGNVYGGGNKADAQSNVTVENSVITLDGADVTGIVSTESFEPSVNAALMRLAEADTGAGDAEANKTQRTINLINSKMGTLQISAKQDTETSLYLVGSNTVGEITGGKASEIVFDGTGTPAGEAILTLTKEGASFDMSGDKDIVARNVASGTLLVDGKYKTAAETTVTLENAFGDVVYDLGKDAIGSTDLLLTDAGIVIGTGDKAQTIGASSVKVSESSKTLAEAQLGSVALVTQGAEFVADEGMRSIRAAAKEGSFTAFGAMAGGYNRYETGSHVDVEGFSLAVGTAGRINNLTLAGFVEAGWASSESHVASTEADADHDYYGVGAAMRYDFQSPFYLDGAVRLGQISTEFDGSYGTGTAKYDADGLYATAHIGAGYVFDLTPDVKLDAYGRYLLSYVEGDDVTLESDAKERFSMDDTTTHAVRLGARLEGAFQTFDWYAGLAYEHVFDGKAKGELKFAGATAALDAPSLKDDSAIVDLGFTMKPEANGPWTIGVGLKGYAGDRRGGTGSVNVLYTF